MAKKSITKKKTARSKRSQSKHVKVSVNVQKLKREHDPSLQLTWVDLMEIHLRGDIDVATLRFYSAVGGTIAAEACRLQTSTTHLKAIVDVLCRTLDYYPAQPE